MGNFGFDRVSLQEKTIWCAGFTMEATMVYTSTSHQPNGVLDEPIRHYGIVGIKADGYERRTR